MEDMSELDQLLNDIENEGFDTEPSKPTGKREAIEKSITDAGTGFVDTFKLDPVEQTGQFLEKAVPRGIREEYDVVKEAGTELKELYDKNISDLKGGAKKTVDLIKERTPQNIIYRNILSKISTALGSDDPDEQSYSREPTQDEIVAQQLENVFDKNRKKESINDIIKEVKDDNRFATNISVLQDILGNLKYDTQFKEVIVENYYRKSLELQFKSLYVTKQQLEITKSGFDLFKTQLEAIVKNTGLPDLVKLRSTEQLKDNIQNRFRENLTDMFYSKDNPLQAMKQNVIGNVGKFISGAKMGFETGNMMLEQANELSKSGMGSSKAEMIGGEAASFVRNYVGDELGRAAEKNDFIRDKLFKTKMAMADPRETLFNMANEQFDKGTRTGRITSKLLKMVGGITQADRQDFTRVGEYEPDEATSFDYRTKNSIVKVIPSLLSKIYTEINSMRTGKDSEGLYFDYDTGKLQKDSNVKENILRDTAVTFQGAAGGNLDRFTSLLEDSSETEFSEEAKNHIKGVIVGHLVKKGSVSPEAMLKDEFLEQFDPEFRDLVKSSITSTIDKGKDELQVLDEFKSSLEGTINNIPLMDKQIEDYFKNGQINELEDMGLVKYDPLRKMYQVDRDAYTNLLKQSITYDIDKKPESFESMEQSKTLLQSKVAEGVKQTQDDTKLKTKDKLDSIKDEVISKVSKDDIIKTKDTLGLDKGVSYLGSIKDNTIESVNGVTDTVVKKVKDTDTVNVSVAGGTVKENVLNNSVIQSIKDIDTTKAKDTVVDAGNIVKDKIESRENFKLPTIPTLVNTVNTETINHKTNLSDSVTGNYTVPEFTIPTNFSMGTYTQPLSKMLDSVDTSEVPEVKNNIVNNNVTDTTKELKQTIIDKKDNLVESTKSKIPSVDTRSMTTGYNIKDNSNKVLSETKDNLTNVTNTTIETTKQIVKPMVDEVMKAYESKKVENIKNIVTEETKNITNTVKTTLEETKDKLNDISENVEIPSIQDILDKEHIDTETMYTKYQESGAMKSGTNFLSWANTLGYTLTGRKFSKFKDKVGDATTSKKDNIKESIFGKVKSEFDDMKTVDPVTGEKKLSIAGVFKKTREWDRKMFMSIPKMLGKGMSTAFKSIPMLAGGIGKVVKGGAGIVGDMYGISKKARSIGKEHIVPGIKAGAKAGKVVAGTGYDISKTGLGGVVDIGRGVMGMSKREKPNTDESTKTSIFTNTINKVTDTLKDVKDTIKTKDSNSDKVNTKLDTMKESIISSTSDKYDSVKDKITEMKEPKKPKSLLGDKDGDGDRDMGWKDRLSNKIKDSKDKILGKKEKVKPTKKDGILSSIWGMLKGALPFLGTIASLGGSLLSGVMKIGPAIASLGGLLTSAVGGIAKGVMSAGSWVKGKLFGGEKPDVKGKANSKTKTGGLDTKKPKGKKPKPSKIMSTLKSFKGKILKKLGKKAGVKALAILTAKIAARAVPIAGLALLAYDAVMIAKYMIADDMSLSSAVSKAILGFDLFDDNEAAVDENGNPIKPDENLDKDAIEKSVDEDKQSGMDSEIENENKPKDTSFFGGVMDKIKSYTTDKNTVVGGLVDKSSNFFKTGSFKATPNKAEIMGIIDKAAERTGVDPNTLKTFAAIESGFDPNAKAKTSSASGLFQFIKSTWNAMLKKYGPKYDIDPMTSPYDPMANAIMGAEYIKENTKVLKGVRDNVGLTDLYMAHFLGPGGAKQLFSARPDEFAAAVLPAAARANKSIFFNKDKSPRTVSEVYNLMQNRLVKKASSYGFKQDNTVDEKQATSISKAKSNINKAIVASRDNKPVNNPNVTKEDLNKSKSKVKEITTNTKEYSIADGKGGQVTVSKEQYDKLEEYDKKLTVTDTDNEQYDKLMSERENVRKQIIDESKTKLDTSKVNNDDVMIQHDGVTLTVPSNLKKIIDKLQNGGKVKAANRILNNLKKNQVSKKKDDKMVAIQDSVNNTSNSYMVAANNTSDPVISKQTNDRKETKKNITKSIVNANNMSKQDQGLKPSQHDYRPNFTNIENVLTNSYKVQVGIKESIDTLVQHTINSKTNETKKEDLKLPKTKSSMDLPNPTVDLSKKRYAM